MYQIFRENITCVSFHPSRSICGIYGEIVLFAKILCTINSTSIHKNLLNMSEYLWYLRHPTPLSVLGAAGKLAKRVTADQDSKIPHNLTRGAS